MKKVIIFCYASNKGEYVYNAEDFGDALNKEFKRLLKNKPVLKNPWIDMLNIFIQSKYGKDISEEDFAEVFEIEFLELVYLDHKFAKKLNLFDIVNYECLKADEEVGWGIIELCKSISLSFIVSHKTYKNPKTLNLGFEVCCEDKIWLLHKAMVSQTINTTI